MISNDRLYKWKKLSLTINPINLGKYGIEHHLCTTVFHQPVLALHRRFWYTGLSHYAPILWNVVPESESCGGPYFLQG